MELTEFCSMFNFAFNEKEKLHLLYAITGHIRIFPKMKNGEDLINPFIAMTLAMTAMMMTTICL